jgi:ATP-binding cassette subfamily B protein
MFTAFAVNRFIGPGSLTGLPLFIIVYFGAILVDGVASLFFFRHSMKVELYLAKDIRRRAFVHLQELSIPFYNTSSVGYLLARVMSDVDRISSVIAWGFTHAFWNVCYVIGAFVYMFILKPSLALLLLAYVPVITAVVWFFQSKIIRLQRKVREANSEITGAYNEGITGAKVTKTLVIEDVVSREFSGITRKMYRYSIRSARISAFLTPLMSVAGALAVGTVLYKGGLLVDENLMDFGILSALITYALGIVEPIVQLVGMLENVIVAQVGIERVTALIDAPVTVADTPEVIEKYGDVFHPKKENWEPIRGDITFENVSFRYPDGEEDVLQDFNLHIPAGTTVAIVGETGAGKSTLVNLACRFFEPTKGRVLIDGKDSRERSTLWLHSALGYVLQTPFLFSGTIMENIRYGRLDATDEEVIEAAKLVSADVVAVRLPKGYHEPVGEGGDRLSSGEKQLISLARAVLADPPIFVLDEATANVDTETERLIQNAISRVLKGRTSFIIAHRLSTIRGADLILVVDKGRIVEKGTHLELLRKGGRYAALCRAMQLREEHFSVPELEE